MPRCPEDTREELLEVHSPLIDSQEMPATALIRPMILPELLHAFGRQGDDGVDERPTLAQRLVRLGA